MWDTLASFFMTLSNLDWVLSISWPKSSNILKEKHNDHQVRPSQPGLSQTQPGLSRTQPGPVFTGSVLGLHRTGQFLIIWSDTKLLLLLNEWARLNEAMLVRTSLFNVELKTWFKVQNMQKYLSPFRRFAFIQIFDILHWEKPQQKEWHQTDNWTVSRCVTCLVLWLTLSS